MDDWVRLRLRDVPLEWHEAVAIVRAVADAVAGGELRAVPDAGSLALDPLGAVHVLQSGDAPAAPGEGAAALGGLLAGLLPAQGAPLELVRLTSPAGGSTVEEFAQGLTFFERPSKERDLQALAARLAAAREQHRLEEELESLTRKARADDQRPADPPQAKRSPKRRVRVGTLLLAGSGGTAVLLAVVVLLALGPSAGQPSTSDPARVAPGNGLLTAIRATARSMLGGVERSRVAEREQPERARQAEPRRVPKRPRSLLRRELPEPLPARADTSSLIPEGESPIAFGQVEEVVVPVSNVPPLPATRMHASDVLLDVRRAGAVFDRGDEEVIPAVLVRPHLPSISQPEGRLISALDVVISEEGRVEQVRLVATSPERRYYDAMILAAVKAWIFQPASRNGRPVRYRVRIPLT